MLRHACGFALTNKGHDTGAPQAYLGHKNIQHTVRYIACRNERGLEFLPTWTCQPKTVCSEPLSMALSTTSDQRRNLDRFRGGRAADGGRRLAADHGVIEGGDQTVRSRA
jgi:hypothetical protein